MQLLAMVLGEMESSAVSLKKVVRWAKQIRWISTTQTKEGDLKFGCKFCADANFKTSWARGDFYVKGVQKCSFVQHEKT